MKLCVDSLRACLDGSIPPILATCAPDGTPNVSFVSQMAYVDSEHVALSYQFFNKTRANLLAHPYSTAYITDSETGASFRLSLHFQRTDTSGALFESMKARLAGIASQTGMQGVFRLQGADIHRVLAIEAVPGATIPPRPARRNALTALRAASSRLARCTELERLLDETLASLDEEFGLPHSMILMLDGSRDQLYTVASRGYEESGVGSEIALGSGIIGVAAAQREAIRITYMTTEYNYGRAMRSSALQAGVRGLQAEIPFPGLAEPHSQIAVPIVGGNTTLGVLYADSMEDYRFGYQEEDALAILAGQLGGYMIAIQQCSEQDEPAATLPAPPAPDSQDARPLRVRRYAENDSVFVDDDYLIKGVAGAVFWKLVNDYTRQGRTEFSNRELRLDPAIRLPDIDDNLEARLVLLARRLHERCPAVLIEKTGRGRFRLCVRRPLELEESLPAA